MGARHLRRIETKRDTRVITLVPRQVSMAFLRTPVMRYIDIDDSDEVIGAIRLSDERTR
jgi:Serine dehydrogenase proteinase